jgi:hypothetical protein
MKTAFFKPAIIIALAFLSQSFTTVKPPHGIQKMVGTSTAEVSYNGMQGDFLVFDLKIANATKGRSFLTIRNEAGDEMYTAIFSEANVQQVIKIDVSTQTQVHFMISSRAFSYSKKFNVNTQYIQQIQVNEAK